MSRLRIEGEVEQPLEVGFEDLAALPGQVPDLSSRIPGRGGAGVELASLLARARPRAVATHATLVSADGGFRASVPLAAVTGAVVAYREGAEPLSPTRGGPFRFFVPTDAACASAEVDRCANVKYLASIRLTAGPGEDTRPTSPTAHAALHSHDDE